METKDALETAATGRWPVWVIPTCVVVTTVMVVILRGMGRLWWCKGGEWWIWAGDIWSMHASQHFLDPYSFTRDVYLKVRSGVSGARDEGAYEENGGKLPDDEY